jgi:hypothetical protein
VAETPSGLSKQEKDYIKGLKSGLHFDLSAIITSIRSESD